jgi:hypothetical protein
MNTYRHDEIDHGLTDTFVKQVKQLKSAGDKYSDGQGMYLLVNSAGKYWRFCVPPSSRTIPLRPEAFLAGRRANAAMGV